MNKNDFIEIHIQSLVQHHQLSGLPKPKHPLFSIQRFEDFPKRVNEQRVKLISDFYQITLKRDCDCKYKYGQTIYDFDEGLMSFFAPKQVGIIEPGNVLPSEGWLLLIRPDFLIRSTLNQKIKSYGFFDYAINEALILSEQEEKSIEKIFEQIETEYFLPIDNFSQDVVISCLDLLLTYCNRYYNRQFITRKVISDNLLQKFEKLLDDYFKKNFGLEKGLPTLPFLAGELNLSPKYLSDSLKKHTGQSAQQHIHGKLIEKAKEKLSTTDLSVSEIAYDLGFEQPQSFSKLFKTKTKLSPSEFRLSFN